VRPRYWQGNQNVWEDSVLPVHNAGLVKLWEDSYTVDSSLTLHPAPGHTPGSSVLRLESGKDKAVFIGDLHSHRVRLWPTRRFTAPSALCPVASPPPCFSRPSTTLRCPLLVIRQLPHSRALCPERHHAENMTVSDHAYKRLAASLKRAYVDHHVEQQSDGHVLLVLGDVQRLVLQTLCGDEGLAALERQERGTDGTRYTLTDSEAEALADRVEGSRRRR
jgi:hypothetical protein